jgi:thiamine-phosphate pyrophosphorylase
MQLYYITDRSAFHGDEASRRRSLLEKIAEATRAGVNYIQLREKDLSAGDLEHLAGAAIDLIREIQSHSANSKTKTKLLVNSRTDIALAVGADGVHLRSDDISPREVASICLAAKRPNLLTAVSCHSVEDVNLAKANGADFAVLAPIFGKPASPQVPALGFEILRAACQHHLPLFALGGVTLDNTPACRQAGAAGIAGIRLFQNNSIQEVVRKLRGL